MKHQREKQFYVETVNLYLFKEKVLRFFLHNLQMENKILENEKKKITFLNGIKKHQFNLQKRKKKSKTNVPC